VTEQPPTPEPPPAAAVPAPAAPAPPVPAAPAPPVPAPDPKPSAPEAVVWPAPVAEGAAADAGGGAGPSSMLTDRPEVAIGGAFAGGLVLAMILKRLAK
jgi:hypothetical protein